MSVLTSGEGQPADLVRNGSPLEQATFVRNAIAFFFLALAVQWGVALGYYRHATFEKLTKHPFTFYEPVNFSDLWNYAPKLTHPTDASSVYTGEPVFNYPAPAAYVYSFFLNCPHSVTVFSLTVILCTLAFGVLLARALARPPVRTWEAYGLVAGLLVFAYPLQYELHRTNLEGIAWCLFGSGIVCYFARKDLLAALFWAMGILVKPFPVLLFFLLVKRRKYRAILAAAAAAVLLEFAALVALGPTVWQALGAMSTGLDLYKRIYILAYRHSEARFQHSILDSMKAIARHWAHWDGIVFGDPVLVKLYHVYQVIAVLLLGLCIFVFRRLPGLNQFFAIVLITLLLAPVGADYTLLLAYGILGAFLLYLGRDVATGSTRIDPRAVLSILLLFSVLLSPRNYLKSYGGCFTTAALLGLLWVAARVPMYCSLFDDTDSAASGAIHPAPPA